MSVVTQQAILLWLLLLSGSYLSAFGVPEAVKDPGGTSNTASGTLFQRFPVNSRSPKVTLLGNSFSRFHRALLLAGNTLK